MLEQDIIDKYLGFRSVLSLANEYHVNTNVIQKILDKNNIKKISQAKRLNPNLKEDYFKTIDSPEKAYWLGWLLTDGGISKKNDIQLSLIKEDKYILEMLQNDLGLTNHIKPFCKKYYKFDFCFKNMCEDLANYNVVPNKSLTLEFPNNIPPAFNSHLLRGMFDGDGGITIGMSKHFHKERDKYYIQPYIELSFTGTYSMCEGFQNILINEIGLPEKNINTNHSIYRVRWSNKEEVLSICDYLYKDCGEYFLKRKYKKYQELNCKGE